MHGRAFLGGVHGVTAELMAAGDTVVSTAIVGSGSRPTGAGTRSPGSGRGSPRICAGTGSASIAALLRAIPESLDG